MGSSGALSEQMISLSQVVCPVRIQIEAFLASPRKDLMIADVRVA